MYNLAYLSLNSYTYQPNVCIFSFAKIDTVIEKGKDAHADDRSGLQVFMMSGEGIISSISPSL